MGFFINQSGRQDGSRTFSGRCQRLADCDSSLALSEVLPRIGLHKTRGYNFEEARLASTMTADTNDGNSTLGRSRIAGTHPRALAGFPVRIGFSGGRRAVSG